MPGEGKKSLQWDNISRVRITIDLARPRSNAQSAISPISPYAAACVLPRMDGINGSRTSERGYIHVYLFCYHYNCRRYYKQIRADCQRDLHFLSCTRDLRARSRARNHSGSVRFYFRLAKRLKRFLAKRMKSKRARADRALPKELITPPKDTSDVSGTRLHLLRHTSWRGSPLKKADNHRDNRA